MSVTYPATHDDLLTAPAVGILSTITPEGLVQSTAVWFLFEDGTLKFSFSNARKKLRNLQANPAATFFLLDPANAFRFVEIRGTATIEPDADFSFRGKVGAHYGADLSGFDQPGDERFVVTLNPSRINAQ